MTEETAGEGIQSPSTDFERIRIDRVLDRMRWMREQRIWPNGSRYLWTDAWGLVLLVSLHRALGDRHYLEEAIWLVDDVERVLGRPRGLRIGEAPDRDGQYYHYLMMWIYALAVLGDIEPDYRRRAVRIAQDIHGPFVQPAVGVHWKMAEDLSAPYPGFGLGALDPIHGMVVYRLLDERLLAREIEDLRRITEQVYPALRVTQDLGLGMLLWMSHFFPDEPWAATLKTHALQMLDWMWIDPPGYFCREPLAQLVRFAFTNYGVSVGLQAVGAHPDRVEELNRYFRRYRSGDHYDTDAITHVMACCSWWPGRMIRA